MSKKNRTDKERAEMKLRSLELEIGDRVPVGLGNAIINEVIAVSGKRLIFFDENNEIAEMWF